MSSDLAIKVEGISKRYHLGERGGYRRLSEVIQGTLLRPFRRDTRPVSREILWAVKDLSFEIERGEVVGVIGANGAGKSTLLKILARISRPTEGRAEIHGRVGSLLEVGTGFHLELTGRENVFLNGAILGMRRKEILAKYDEIVAFADVERFIDTPVKHYSSGMRVRLAFSVAAHLEPEILFIDEVLSVGDAAFQAKSLGKMHDVARGGRTVLFVSHNMGSVSGLCTRAIWMENGTIRRDGDPQAVIEEYLTQGASTEARWVHPAEATCGSTVRINAVEVLSGTAGTQGHVPFLDPVKIAVETGVAKTSWSTVGVRLTDAGGNIILTTTDAGPESKGTEREAGDYINQVEVPGGLLRPGRYAVSVFARLGREMLDEHEHCLQFEILPSPLIPQGRPGVITPVLAWSTQRR